jgi:hypothetical protein
MDPFKKTIASAVTTLIMVMAFTLIPVKEAEGKAKAPFDQSYLPPGNMAKARRPAKLSAPKGEIWKTARSIDKDGMFRSIQTSRQSYVLPHMEQY